MRCAVEIVAGEGYDMLTLSALAEKCGIRKASLYYHFQSKEELIRSIWDHYSSSCLHLTFHVDLSKDVTTVFRTALDHWKEVFLSSERAPFISMVDQRKAVDERAWETANSLRLMVESQSTAIIEHFTSDGILMIRRPETVAKMFSSAILDCLVNRPEDSDSLVSSFLSAFQI